MNDPMPMMDDSGGDFMVRGNNVHEEEDELCWVSRDEGSFNRQDILARSTF